MSDDFHATRMGQKFYEGTMIRIADSLERIAKAQEESNKLKIAEMVREMVNRMGKERFIQFVQQLELEE